MSVAREELIDTLLQDPVSVAFFSLVGVVLGWLLKELSVQILEWRERRKCARLVLYCLLNLHHHILPFDLEGFTQVLKKWHESTSLEPISEAEWIAAMRSLGQFIQSMTTAFKPQLSEALLLSYDTGIQNLATIDPYLAFSLSDRTKVEGQLSSYLNDAKSQLSHIDDLSKLKDDIDPFVSRIQLVLNSELTSLIEHDILTVSRRLGWASLLRSRRYIRKNHFRVSTELQRKFNQKMGAVLNEKG